MDIIERLKRDRAPREVVKLAERIQQEQPSYEGDMPDKDWVPGVHRGQGKAAKLRARPEKPQMLSRPLQEMGKGTVLFSLGVYHSMIPQQAVDGKPVSAVRQFEAECGHDTLTKLYGMEKPYFMIDSSAMWPRGRWGRSPQLIYSMPPIYFGEFGEWLELNKFLQRSPQRSILWEARWELTAFPDPTSIEAKKVHVWFALPAYQKGLSRLRVHPKLQLPVIYWQKRVSSSHTNFLKTAFNLKESQI